MSRLALSVGWAVIQSMISGFVGSFVIAPINTPRYNPHPPDLGRALIFGGVKIKLRTLRLKKLLEIVIFFGLLSLK